MRIKQLRGKFAGEMTNACTTAIGRTERRISSGRSRHGLEHNNKPSLKETTYEAIYWNRVAKDTVYSCDLVK